MLKNEKLSGLHNLLLRDLVERRDSIEQIISYLENNIDFDIKDRVRISSDSNQIHYYLISKQYDTHGKYVRKKDVSKVKNIVQNEYNINLYRSLKKESKMLNDSINFYENNNIELIYDSLHPGRKKLVEPVYLPIDDYVSDWIKVEYERKNFEDDANEFYTSKGIRVRSKSEVIIADILDRYNIPYRYEYPIYLKGWGYVYADFYCLNTSTRVEFAWEHFGMMDNEEYSKKAVSKIDKYLQNGYFLGKNFIASFESSIQPLSTKSIEKIIKEYLL